MIIEPNLVRIIVMIGIGLLLVLSFTYFIRFIKPLIIAIFLILIAYFIYRFLVTGTLSF